MRIRTPRPYSKRALEALRAASYRQHIMQFGLNPPGSRCAFCRLPYPLAEAWRGWKKIWVCVGHTIAMDAPPPEPQVEVDFSALVRNDPRPSIERWKKEGVIVKDIGCVLVEGFEAQGPAFVTELRTIDKKFQLVCVSPKEAINRTAFEFLIYRCRAILHGIHTMMGITDDAFPEGTPNSGGYKS